ncbi:hypothetical protein AUC69_14660 [Methyloceanibacter superfactus]|uniref:Uncharacterized protein n=1 Tax=Methyloceanibacter superfactus TaxID=1774969 RepID=A0A1E3VS92_9HYPH|nr:hypothetical protein [Methyloceanibacter superfactus]ODR96400.1 hypothetical protein AUC69_14660 [Methyloceanibacter superfactus]
MSRRSADALGFRRNGTANVRVQYLRRAPLNGDDSYERKILASRGLGQYAAVDKPAAAPRTTGVAQDPIATASLPGTSPPLPQRVTRPVETAALPTPRETRDDVAALGWPAR